jgi:HEAT repeats
MHRSLRTRSYWGLCALLALVIASAAPVARADDPRSAYLVKLLQGSTQFRVRAQAAISLGTIESSSSVVGALTGALRDEHPAVRAAAAASLGKVGDKASVPPLRVLEKDPEDPVRSAARAAIARLESASAPMPAPAPQMPSGPALYYVAVAQPASRVAGVDAKLLSDARGFIKERIQQMQGVAVAPDGESSTDAERAMKKRSLRGYYIDSSVMSVEKKPDGSTRVAVSVILATYPGRDMRAIMQGAATVTGGGSQDQSQALQGALSGALRQLPQALGR